MPNTNAWPKHNGQIFHAAFMDLDMVDTIKYLIAFTTDIAMGKDNELLR